MFKQYLKNKRQFANNNCQESFWSLFNKNYLATKSLYQHFKRILPKLNGSILDVGCCNKPYEKLATNCTKYIGLEYDTSASNLEDFNSTKVADFYYDGETFPFENESFDNIFSSQVLEHVPNPERIIFEMARVLKKNGLVLVSLPFVFPEHLQPYDFYRYTTFGIKTLFKKNNLEIIELNKTLSEYETMSFIKTILFRKNLFNIFIHNVFVDKFIYTKKRRNKKREGANLFSDMVVLAKKIK